MLLSQLVQGKIFKLECHPQKNAECFADFCEFKSLGSYNGCIVYWMWFIFSSSLNFIYQNYWSLDSSLSAHSGMTTSEYPVLNFFACMHVCTKAEGTLIFFPRTRETKVIAPHPLIYARLMHRIQQSSLNEHETCR